MAKKIKDNEVNLDESSVYGKEDMTRASVEGDVATEIRLRASTALRGADIASPGIGAPPGRKSP